MALNVQGGISIVGNMAETYFYCLSENENGAKTFFYRSSKAGSMAKTFFIALAKLEIRSDN
jgi:hypothetical protein